MTINALLQLVLQCGALGLLAVLLFGASRVAIVYAPLVKDFLVGLLTAQSTILQQQAAHGAKLDELHRAVVRLEADSKRAAEGLEQSVEGARDEVLVELGARARVSRPSQSGMVPAPASRRANGGG